MNFFKVEVPGALLPGILQELLFCYLHNEDTFFRKQRVNVKSFGSSFTRGKKYSQLNYFLKSAERLSCQVNI